MAGGHISEKQVRDLAKTGLSQAEIAKKLGCAQGTIGYFVKRYNIPISGGRSSKNHPTTAYDSIEAERLRINDVVAAAGVTPPQCEITKMNPMQALEVKLKWPWAGKIQQMTPNDLKPDFYEKLLEYHDFEADEIAWMFGFKNLDVFNVWLKKWGYAGKSAEQNYSPKPAEIIPDNIPTAVEPLDSAGNFKLGEKISNPTMNQIEEFFAPDPVEDQIDLAGWEEFEGGHKRQDIFGDCLAVGRKIYIGRNIKMLSGWQRCTIMIRPDGKQIAVKKAAKGAKIGFDNGRPCICCKEATDKIQKLVGIKPKYRLLKSLPELVVFALDRA